MTQKGLKVISCVPIGEGQTYDLEVEHPDHQFYLANGVLTSNSHAVAYAVDSYYCAWLQTKYPDEWCCGYLQSVSNSTDKLERAIADVKSLGYTIKKIDINHSGYDWTIIPGEEKSLARSFKSCKGIGEAAVEEIMLNRPYSSVEDLLWNADGSWKHSKFNKRCFEALVKIGAFDSMNLIGDGRPFSSYAHMHFCMIENLDLLKKSPKRDPDFGKRALQALIEKTRDDIQPWTRSERIMNMSEVLSDVSLIDVIPEETLEYLSKKGVKAIEEFGEAEREICWFVVDSVEVKRTKNGKAYYRMRVFGNSTTRLSMNVWGLPVGKENTVKPYDVCIGELSNSDFGFATTFWKLKVLEIK
jgi:DNA polymerase III alpha subunit